MIVDIAERARATDVKHTGNTMLTTGGGSGIGRALAHRWHDAGDHVIVTGRRQPVLNDAIAGRERMAAYVLDVTTAKHAPGRALACPDT